MSAISIPATSEAGHTPIPGTALWRLIVTETKLLCRERVRVFLTIGLPLVLIIILGSIPVLKKPSTTFGGHSFIDYYTLVMVVFSAALLALTGVPLVLAGYRERGVLRRLRTTPIGPYRVLAAQLAAAFGICVVTTVLILLVARIGFSVPLPRQAVGFVVTAILATAALLSVGLVIASLAPTARTAQGIGALLFYVLMFFAGLWLPLPEMPKVLQHISHATPLGAAVQAMTNCSQGHWPTALELITLAAWAIALSIAAGKLFRWE
jgi:ABC-2 type transport system permease protein